MSDKKYTVGQKVTIADGMYPPVNAVVCSVGDHDYRVIINIDDDDVLEDGWHGISNATNQEETMGKVTPDMQGHDFYICPYLNWGTEEEVSMRTCREGIRKWLEETNHD